jgi:O-antigen ligase
VAAGSSVQVVIYPLKVFAFYLLVLPIATLLGTRVWQERFERWILALSTAGSAYVLVSSATGSLLPSSSVTDQVVTLGVTSDVTRIRVSLIELLLLGSLLLGGRVIAEGLRPFRIVQAILIVGALALSFNRSTWGPLLVAGAAFVWLRPGPRTPLNGLRRGIPIVLLLAVGFALSSHGELGERASSISRRAASIANPRVFSENSYRDRASENSVAIDTIEHHPVFGVGLGRPYGARRPVYVDNPPRIEYEDRLFIHNGILGVWLRLGLLGMVGFSMLGALVVRHVRQARRSGAAPEVVVRRLAAGCALFALALQSLFAIGIDIRPTILVAVCALALLGAPSDDDAGVEMSADVGARTTPVPVA